MGGLPIGILVTELGAQLTLTGADFTDNSITGYGVSVELELATLMGSGAGDIVLDDVSFVDNRVDASSSATSTYTVGAIMVYGPSLTGDGVTVTGNDATLSTGAAATMVFYGSPTVLSHLDVRENSVSGSRVPSWGSIIQDTGAYPSITNFVLAGNDVSMPAWIAYGPISACAGTRSQGDITGNTTYGFAAYSGVMTLAGEATFSNVNIVNNAVSDTGGGGYCWGANIVMSYGDNTIGTFDHVNSYGNTGTRWNVDRLDMSCNTDSLNPTNSIAADPLYVDTSGATGTTWDLHLGAGSPSVDAGDPTVFDVGASVSDIGGYGGLGGGW